jgi:Zn-dependent protease with chaperone function
MPRSAGWILLLAGANAAAAALLAKGPGGGRESLLPLLRAGEEHGLQLERAVSGAALTLSADDERRLGQELRRAAGPTDPRLERLGRRLERTGLVPRFAGRAEYRLVPDASPQAFAAPGGLIFVTTGLVRLVGGDESRLSFALGHELAHAELGHTANLVRYRAWLDAAGVPGGDLVQLLRRVPAQSYSRAEELEADALAVKLLRAADLRASAGAETLEALDPGPAETAGHQDPVGVLVEGLGDYFHTHPGRTERLDRLRANR